MDIFPIPMEEMLVLRTLSKQEASAYLTEHHPALGIEVREALVKMAMPEASQALTHVVSVPGVSRTTYVVDPLRNTFILTAYLAGASQYQIGMLFGVQRQTIYSIIRKFRDAENTLADRAPVRVTQARLTAWWQWWLNEPSTRTIDPKTSSLNSWVTQLHAIDAEED